ncbi:MAG TPA: hypothetical protein VNL73_08640 [Verrucomicrobiae bacterium]|nr:hypothetical protein [Verrucomicrobiae bacterium]
MLQTGKKTASAFALFLAFVLFLIVQDLKAQELPSYLRDRGPGVSTSMFGTYLQKGEWLVYPFYEFYADENLEYKPSELGYGLGTDYRGRYRASEGLLFVGYGITPDLVMELEAAVIGAQLTKSANDTSAMPSEVEESGLGDVEGQIRWRFLRENESRPEFFTYFETVFPLQKSRNLIGTSDWEFKLGAGFIRGFGWGTITFRAAAEYNRAERKFEAGEYALEYLRRLSPGWRVVGAIEGNQLDEVTFITEAQWHFHPRYYLKLNNGWGLTTNATDFAPEVGVMLAF